MKNHYQLAIKAPIETVFAYLEDKDKSEKWLKEVEKVEFPNGINEQAPTGTKMVQQIRQSGKVQHYVGEITAYDKPRLLGMRLANQSFSVIITYHLTAIPEGTELKYEGDLTSNSLFLTICLPVIQFFNLRMLKKQLQQLKWSAEAEVVAQQ